MLFFKVKGSVKGLYSFRIRDQPRGFNLVDLFLLLKGFISTNAQKIAQLIHKRLEVSYLPNS